MARTNKPAFDPVAYAANVLGAERIERFVRWVEGWLDARPAVLSPYNEELWLECRDDVGKDGNPRPFQELWDDLFPDEPGYTARQWRMAVREFAALEGLPCPW
jgi:hypothetical protein